MKRFLLLIVILSSSAANLAAQSHRQVDTRTHSEIVQQLIREGELTADCVRKAGGYSKMVSVTPIDLNRDREPEFAVQELASCAGMWDRQWIYRRTPMGYELLLSLAQRSAFRPLNRYTNGYRDVQVNMAASVSMEVVTYICRFDGSRYRDDYAPPRRAATPRGKKQATSVPGTFVIVPTGENAPEAIFRVLSTTTIAPGKHRVNVAGGPCRSQSRARLVYIIDSKETITKGDLFFTVPVGDLISRSGWALRRANSREAARYESCQWR